MIIASFTFSLICCCTISVLARYSNNVFLDENSSSNRTKVIWMVPSWSCVGQNSIDVQQFGIIQNEKQEFKNGKTFAIFYEHSFGRIPYFLNKNVLKPVNGGLPQLGNILEHLEIAKQQILSTIPDENFNGIAVIDIEEFRPTWELSWSNFEVYKKESIKLVRNRKPRIPKKIIEKIAKLEYEAASKSFFLETLKLGKKLRPHAKWGFYLFPKCNGDVAKTFERQCSQLFQNFNNNLSWLWKESTALFPSIYLYPNAKLRSNENMIWSGASILEAKRIQKKFCLNCEIHVFTKIEYDPYHFPNQFYSKQNLASTLEMGMKMNVKSLVIWSTTKNIQNRCIFIKNFVNQTLGPFLKLADMKLDSCRVKRCSAHGECYLKKLKRKTSFFDFQCNCDENFFGKYCEKNGNKYKDNQHKYNSANQYYYLQKSII